MINQGLLSDHEQATAIMMADEPSHWRVALIKAQRAHTLKEVGEWLACRRTNDVGVVHVAQIEINQLLNGAMPGESSDT